MHYLVVRFLTSAFSLKLEDLADEWFVSRATLQNDMAEVREVAAPLSSDAGNPPAPRHEIVRQRNGDPRVSTHLWTLAQQDPANPLIVEEALNAGVPEQLQPILQEIFTRFRIRLTDEGELFLRLY